MKKVLSLLFIIICCICLVGCGTDTKKEAERLHNEYFQPGFKLVEEYQQDWSETDKKFEGKDFDNKISQLVKEKYKPQFLALKEKFNKEKDIKETAELRKQIGYMLDDVLNLADLTFDLCQLPSDTPQEKVTTYLKKIGNLTNNLVSEEMEYKNQYSLLTNGKSSYELTLRNFQQIQKGDSYITVVNLFKMPGRLTNSHESNHALIGNRKLEHYVWEDKGATVRIMFENGKAYQMEQVGLK